MPSDRSDVGRWLADIRHNIALAENFTAGVAYDDFKDDVLRLYAVIRCLEIISEASRRLPDDLKARHPSIAWQGRPVPAVCIARTVRMLRHPWCGSCYRIICRRSILWLSKN